MRRLGTLDARRADAGGQGAAGAARARAVRGASEGKLPVPNFAAGGVATPADAALCMMLGAESVFVGSGIFKSEDPARRAKAIVKAVTHWQDPAGRARGVARPRGRHARPRHRQAHPGGDALAAGVVSGRERPSRRGARAAGRLRGPRRGRSPRAASPAVEVRTPGDLDGLRRSRPARAASPPRCSRSWRGAASSRGSCAELARRAAGARDLRRRDPARPRGAPPAAAHRSGCSTWWSSATPTAGRSTPRSSRSTVCEPGELRCRSRSRACSSARRGVT